MESRTCSAVACQSRIGMGATFCQQHWFMLPSAMQMSIAGLAKRAKAWQADAVQHRFVYALLQARQVVAKLEKRGFQAIAPAYKAQAEDEQRRDTSLGTYGYRSEVPNQSPPKLNEHWIKDK